MSIRTAKEIHCDECSWWERLDGPRVSDEWPSMSRAGWRRSATGRHLCPTCSGVKKRATPVEFENAEQGEEG